MLWNNVREKSVVVKPIHEWASAKLARYHAQNPLMTRDLWRRIGCGKVG